jgi:hypothetical protein
MWFLSDGNFSTTPHPKFGVLVDFGWLVVGAISLIQTLEAQSC